MLIPLPQGAGVQLFVIGEAPLKLCSLSLRVNFPGLPVERCLLLLAMRRQFRTTVQRYAFFLKLAPSWADFFITRTKLMKAGEACK